MDILYTVNRKTSPKSFFQGDNLFDGHSRCTVSSRNIAAFTTTVVVDDLNGKTWASHVYVCDFNMPTHSHKITTCQYHPITALEWDSSGDKLVICDQAGNIQLWTFKEYFLNDWTLIGSASFSGEHILCAVWFHNGKKTALVTEKKDSIFYSEKFNNLVFAPSVRHFGGRAAEGVLVVSSTGMVATVMITKDLQNPVCVASESLGNTRQKITAVDVCYGKNGHFLIAATTGTSYFAIRCYRVLVRKNEDKCNITSQALPSFFLQDGALKDSTTEITHLKFVVREDADSLIVAASGESESFVDVWELREKSQSVHKTFQPKSLDLFKAVGWQHQAQYRCQYPVIAIATTKVPIVSTLPTPSSVMIALSDSSIHYLTRDSLKEVASTSLNMSWRTDEPSAKYFKPSVTISHIDISWLGFVLLAIDTQGNLYVYRLMPDGGTPITLSYACTILEYCLVTGTDWLDLLFCLRSSMIETLCERFDTSFNRQTLATQQYHYMQFLCIKISLYRMLVTGQSKAADLSSLLMIHSIAAAFKSILRPSDLISHDKGPAETLTTLINESKADLDDILFNLDPKEFAVEPSTLQSLRQLIQWVADLVLNLLSKLPEQRMQMKPGGYELLKDYKALNTIRELLVIIRMWGLVKKSCKPVFFRSADNLDVMALLFRLVTRLVQSSGDTSQQVDDGLIDDCCLLPNQIMIPQLHQANSITAIATPILLFQNLPLQLDHGIEPEHISFVPELNTIEGCMHSSQIVDTIRHVYLGKQPMLVKQCTRCGGKAQMQSITRTAAMKAWDHRWTRACHCGGIWRIHKTLQ